MRVLLVHPDFERQCLVREELSVSYNPPALGINVLAEVLRRHGHLVETLDSLMVLLRNGPDRKLSLESEAIKQVASVKYDVVGLNVTSPTRNIAIRIASAVKAIDPNIQIVFGGPHATIMAREISVNLPMSIDAIVVGEAVDVVVPLFERLVSGEAGEPLPGVIHRGRPGGLPSQSVVASEFQSIDYGEYLDNTYSQFFDTIPVMTARGCPFKCSFCFSESLWGGGYRPARVNCVLNGIEESVRHGSVSKIHFNDDIFSYPLERATDLLSKMVSRRIEASMFCNTRIDCLSREFLELYCRAGGGCMYFGIESGSERIRRKMGKRLSQEQILSGAKLIKEFPDIKMGMFLIVGFPDELPSDIESTRKLLEIVQPDEVTCNIAHVHPGTSIYQRAISEGRYHEGDWGKGDRDFFPYVTDQASLLELRQLSASIESQFGAPTSRSSIIRDKGTLDRGVQDQDIGRISVM